MRSVSAGFIEAIPTSLIQRIKNYPLLARVIRCVVNLGVPDALVDVTIAQGPMSNTKLSLNLRREKAFWLGAYELDVQQILCGRLRRGATAWDVGAFIGYHTLLMCRLCGPSHVLAVEPDPDNVMRLLENLKLNDCGDAHVISAALGSHVGRGLMHTSLLDGSQNAVEEISCMENRALKGLEVEVKTLDSMLDTFGPPDLIKADVEGAEDLMLQGAARLLDEVKPFWILEAHGRRGQDAIGMLREKGYEITDLGKGPESEADLSLGQRHVLAEP